MGRRIQSAGFEECGRFLLVQLRWTKARWPEACSEWETIVEAVANHGFEAFALFQQALEAKLEMEEIIRLAIERRRDE